MLSDGENRLNFRLDYDLGLYKIEKVIQALTFISLCFLIADTM